MAKTLVALYDHVSEAQAAVKDLVDAGFTRDDISLVANASAKEYAKYFDSDGKYRTDVDYDDDLTTEEGAKAGAGIGGVVGGLGGLLMGLGLLAVPGVGPALAAGPIVSALVGAGIGAAAGGVSGALVNDGIDEEHASYYAEGVRRGGSLVMLNVADERADNVESILDNHDPVDIDIRVSEWRKTGWQGYDESAEAYTTEQIAEEQARYAVPVVEEDIKVGKREVSAGGKRIRSYVSEREVSEDVTLRNEEVHVERRDVDRPVTDADAAFEEQTVEMTATKEEAVVQKDARVVGEVVIGKTADAQTKTISDTVRKTEVEVVDIDSDVQTSSYNTDIDYYRDHYNTTFASTGQDYTYYEPAYRFGSRLAREESSNGMSWNDVESNARRRWEERNPSTWDAYSDAVRHSFERERTYA
jgi:uncharacterized protein (TIGR02271 family)